MALLSSDPHAEAPAPMVIERVLVLAKLKAGWSWEGKREDTRQELVSCQTVALLEADNCVWWAIGRPGQ